MPACKRRAVLVGDPQQLPATVKSAKGKELELERSLFERLQRAGCPVKMLSVQYRMHPKIREFPSNYFYGGRLEDGCGSFGNSCQSIGQHTDNCGWAAID